ncbi:hypothetical protein EVAR_55236_1 [Eumeta japonica]|uniref:Uncharacterized protein n=1 Tax=Eumeta variegata TaxID=151549 RepID=A0A4C1Y6B6_EUMVA|nr:hypothetical protein EVAR_55236_1 [Eumeta japonica]
MRTERGPERNHPIFFRGPSSRWRRGGFATPPLAPNAAAGGRSSATGIVIKSGADDLAQSLSEWVRRYRVALHIL